MYANVLHKPTVGLSLPYSLPRTFAQCHDDSKGCSQQPREASRVDHSTSPQPKDSKTQRAEAKSCARVAQDARMRPRLPSSWSILLSSLHYEYSGRQGTHDSLGSRRQRAYIFNPPPHPTPATSEEPRLSLRQPDPWLLKVLNLESQPCLLDQNHPPCQGLRWVPASATQSGQ